MINALSFTVFFYILSSVLIKTHGNILMNDFVKTQNDFKRIIPGKSVDSKHNSQISTSSIFNCYGGKTPSKSSEKKTPVKKNEKTSNKSKSKNNNSGKPKKSSILSYSADKLLELQSVTLKMTRSSVKSIYDFIQNKYVTKPQILGKWNIMQDIEIKKNVIINYPASIEFYENNTLRTQFEGQNYFSGFTFHENKWPKKCKIEFTAKACVLDGGNEPVLLSYKGFFKGSVMKPSIIFIRGKIYQTSGNTL